MEQGKTVKRNGAMGRWVGILNGVEWICWGTAEDYEVMRAQYELKAGARKGPAEESVDLSFLDVA